MKRQLAGLMGFMFWLSWSGVSKAASFSLELDTGTGVNQLDDTVQILVLLTLISVAPTLLLMLTSFTRYLVVFGMLRHGLGLQGSPPNQVIIGIALFMTIFTMAPTFQGIYEEAWIPYMSGELSSEESVSRGEQHLRTYMERHVSESSIELFYQIKDEDAIPDSIKDVELSILIPAFVLSEITTAFKIGLLIIIPFLVIDMITASVLLGMGMFMLPPVMVSLPFKILLFVLLDGWNLLAYTLMRGAIGS